MEIVLIVLLAAIAVWWIFLRDKNLDDYGSNINPAPYKVETPVATKVDDVVVPVEKLETVKEPEIVGKSVEDLPVVAESVDVNAEPKVKKPRKPRVKKETVTVPVEPIVVKKAPPPKKSAQMKKPGRKTQPK